MNDTCAEADCNDIESFFFSHCHGCNSDFCWEHCVFNYTHQGQYLTIRCVNCNIKTKLGKRKMQTIYENKDLDYVP